MGKQGFLSRLRKDIAANMMVIGAAAIIPLVGVIGGGVDASRMYIAKSRLQQACDSATLAARKKLDGRVIEDGVIPDDIKDQADNFFEANFPVGQYGTTDVSYQLSAGSETQMDGTAGAAIPTTLMRVFNIPELEIAVNCSADMNLPNIDVMLVLDNSGSMRNSRIAALKSAVFEFYDEIMEAKPDGTRVRIGMVPYANTVNVGEILTDANPDWIKDSHTYQSREATFKEVAKESTSSNVLPRNTTQLGSTNSSHYHWNKNNASHFKPICLDYEGKTFTIGDEIWYITNVEWDANYWGDDWPNNQKAACIADIRKTSTTETETVFDKYIYKPRVFDTSSFKAFNTVTTDTGTMGANTTSSWEGCIEERKTTAFTDFTSIPSEAYDLDIDMVPDVSDPDTQWAPLWPHVTFDRGRPANRETTAVYPNDYEYDCPVAANRLQEWPLNGSERNAAFTTAVNSMVASGYTMHDIGMIWAARFLSPTGIFASDNATAPNGDTIARHIIFMTDGYMEPGPNAYHAYGDYDMEGRIAGFADDGTWSTSQIGWYHSQRLALLCESIKNKNITIWSIAFELDHTTYTENCATGGSARAFEADDSDELIAAFKEIANSIAELRLVS